MNGTTESISAGTRSVQGFIENVDQRRIRGWCYDQSNAGERLALEFLVDGEVLGFTVCNLPRQDLQDLGVGDGRYGFDWPLPRQCQQVSFENVQARILDSQIFIPKLSRGMRRPAAPQGPRITLDHADASGLSGWVRHADPELALSVALCVDGARLPAVPASQFRGDVQESGLDSGRHGFFLALPDSLFDGQAHALSLYIPELDEGMELPAMAARFQPYAAGAYAVRNGVLRGWLDAGALPPGPAELIVHDERGRLASIALDPGPAPAGQRLDFVSELSFRLNDGQAHRLAVSVAHSPYRLLAQGGALSLSWQRQVMGRIDVLDDGGIGGWVAHVGAPEAPLLVELHDADGVAAQTVAALPRNDVAKQLGFSGARGFKLAFPLGFYDGRARAIAVRVDGVELHFRAAYDTPLCLTPEQLKALPPEERYQGFIENLNCHSISGWAWDRKQPASVLHVAVYVDGELAGIAAANRFAARLRSAERSGHHAFQFAFPPRYMNGRQRQIAAVVLEGQMPLPCAEPGVLFPLVDYFGQAPAPAPDGQYRHPALPQLWQPAAALPAPAADPLLSIIVLNWNGAQLLRDLFDSLLRVQWRHRYELLLVDHGSQDESLAVAEEYAARLPLRLLARGANFSFSASNNYAAAQARGDYLVFANNDLVMLHDCLAPLCARLADPRVGAAGPKLLEPMSSGGGAWHYSCHHQGVQFRTDVLADGQRYYAPMELGERATAELAACYQVPVVTAALLMCRAADFRALGGFEEGYVYGLEDVDLCLAIGARLGKAVLCETAAVALHNRSATRDAKILTKAKSKLYDAKQHAHNRELYVERFGRGLSRRILYALLAGDTLWRPAPLRLTFIVTEAWGGTAAGDFFTAMELGEALRRLYGWEVLFAAKDTHQLPGTDVVVAMRHDYHIEKVQELNPGAITVAWARNRIDQWLAWPHFGAYQLIFCSSQKGLDHIAAVSGRRGILLPIATNARRFAPRPPAEEHRSDVTFTGNYWGVARAAIELQDLQEQAYRFAIYGHGWQDGGGWQQHWRGAAPYTALPGIYASAQLVLDDAHPVTRDWDSLNSRVFDALGCGRLVLTNCSDGARALFGARLPTFSSGEQLQTLIRHYLQHPRERERLAAALRQEVLAQHTYDQRAATLRSGLRDFLRASLRFAIKIGVPRREEAQTWGDYHFALGLKRALEAQGHVARIDLLPDWYGGLSAGDDVVIALRGLSAYKPRPTAINLAWLISHPDEVAVAELQHYHHVFVASQPFTGWLRERLGAQVSTLLQCTDPALFYPETADGLALPEAIFVGNSRGQRRMAVQYALQSGIEFGVYGGMWENQLPPALIRAEHVPNASLRHYYSGARAVLNDHWDDMRSQGFISNRIFDAGACGAAIVSDEMAACRALFGDLLRYYRSPAEMAEQVAALRADPRAARKAGTALRKMIVKEHTFAHRAQAILAVVHTLLPAGQSASPLP